MKQRKLSSSTNWCLLGIATFLSSCSQMADFGPVNLDKIQKNQSSVDAPKKEYQIIDITENNLSSYNRKSTNGSGALPPLDSSRVFSDTILAYDTLTLQVVDTAQTGGFGASGAPTIFGPIEVPQNGKISFPYAGEFNCIGMSLDSLQKEIKNRYLSVFNTAEVSLMRNKRKLFRANVIGLVKTSGQFEIDRRGLDIADLVSLSGGTRLEPHLNSYSLHRDGKTYRLTNHQITNHNILVQDGDLLEVTMKANNMVTMMGAVKRPGNHKFPTGSSSLSDFLGSSAGLNLSNSNAKGVFIIRKHHNGNTHLYRFNLKTPEGLINSSKFYMLGDDIIYVTEAPLSRWNRAIRNILPLGSSVTSVAAQGAMANSSFGSN